MKIDAYSVLITLSILVVLSYTFNFLSNRLKIPSVLLLILSGIGLKYLALYFDLDLPFSPTLLEILGISGLIFIVLEASLELQLEKEKLNLIGQAFLSALILMLITAGIIGLIFMNYYETSFKQAFIHAIPLSVISSAIAIPSVRSLEERKREFVVYESTFSDILGIMAFNYLLEDHASGIGAVLEFGWDIILILIISIISTVALIILLNRATTQVRFFLTFAIIIIAYSLAKYLHLPSLILVLCFGLVLNNFRLFNFSWVHRFLSFERLSDVSKELKLMTEETAFIIRTFFFLAFGYSVDLSLLMSGEVLVTGIIIITLTVLLRFLFFRYWLTIHSTPLMLIAPRGLITILLFYSIPAEIRLTNLSDGVLLIVIVLTSLAMTLGLLLNKQSPKEEIKDLI
jgi:NhaP-type Na+/H+ or K+/H+ antiporter